MERSCAERRACEHRLHPEGRNKAEGGPLISPRVDRSKNSLIPRSCRTRLCWKRKFAANTKAGNLPRYVQTITVLEAKFGDWPLFIPYSSRSNSSRYVNLFRVLTLSTCPRMLSPRVTCHGSWHLSSYQMRKGFYSLITLFLSDKFGQRMQRANAQFICRNSSRPKVSQCLERREIWWIA